MQLHEPQLVDLGVFLCRLQVSTHLYLGKFVASILLRDPLAELHGPAEVLVGRGEISLTFAQVSQGFVRRGLFPSTSGGVPMIDVRDLAAVVAAALQPGRGPRRYMAGGHFLGFGDVGRAVAELTGRRILCPRVPGAAMRFYGRVADFSDHFFGLSLGPSHDAMVTLTRGVPCDDSRTLAELGVRPRPIEETLRDTMRWMFERELIPAKFLGRVAE